MFCSSSYWPVRFEYTVFFCFMHFGFLFSDKMERVIQCIHSISAGPVLFSIMIDPALDFMHPTEEHIFCPAVFSLFRCSCSVHILQFFDRYIFLIELFLFFFLLYLVLTFLFNKIYYVLSLGVILALSREIHLASIFTLLWL